MLFRSHLHNNDEEKMIPTFYHGFVQS